MKFTAIIVFTLVTVSTYGQTLSNEIDAIYNFQPSKLSDKEQESKFPALDSLWNKVKSDTSHYLPQLRLELRQIGHNPYFYYDGSSLLLSLSNAVNDKQLAVQAIAKCDLADISRKMYITTLNNLAQEDINVTTAAVKILQDDKFSFFLPEHAMTFNQGYCLTYMLLPIKQSVYVDTLITLFSNVSTTSKKSIITTLWFAYSCKGDGFLKAIMTNPAEEKEVREYAKKIMKYTNLTKDQKEYLKIIGKENLEEMREMSLQRFSDEAVAQLDMTTRIMRSEKDCQ